MTHNNGGSGHTPRTHRPLDTASSEWVLELGEVVSEEVPGQLVVEMVGR